MGQIRVYAIKFCGCVDGEMLEIDMRLMSLRYQGLIVMRLIAVRPISDHLGRSIASSSKNSFITPHIFGWTKSADTRAINIIENHHNERVFGGKTGGAMISWLNFEMDIGKNDFNKKTKVDFFLLRVPPLVC